MTTRSRRFRALAAFVSVLIGLAIPLIGMSGAGAITVDNGWTQENNGDYPVTHGPSCSGLCEIWPPGSTVYFYVSPSLPANVAQAVRGAAWLWDVYRATDSTLEPLLLEYNGTHAAGIAVGQLDFSGTSLAADCADTVVYSSGFSSDGGRNPYTITGAVVYLNSAKISSAGCGPQAAVTHEFGHALGLGHTLNPNELMYPSVHTNIYYPQIGDRHGMECIYARFNCTAGP